MKISIIGVGRVGSTVAYTLLTRGLSEELVLVDKNLQLAQGEAQDLEHARAFNQHRMKIVAGSYEDTRNSDILVMTCSVPWSKGYQSRYDLGADNVKLFQKELPRLAQYSPNANLLIVTNPVDVMTYQSIKITGFDPSKVFGTGTLIDSARFRALLSNKMGIHSDDLRAYVLGEHGDRQFPVFSSAQAGGVKILKNEDSQAIFERAKKSGHLVMQNKGHSSYAISMAVTYVIDAIVHDRHCVVPLSVMVQDYKGVSDTCLSVPVIIGRKGVLKILEPELSEEEAKSLQRCAEEIKSGITQSNSDNVFHPHHGK